MGIASEVMFFFAFFWAFFHSRMNPVLLLTSGATCTWSHHAILCGDCKGAILALQLTIVLAIIFTGVQLLEYCTAAFNISDSVFGSTFYMATGFHGFHVYRYLFLNCVFNPFTIFSFYSTTSLWVRSCCLILAFC